ncbi:MAG: hypothetical protein WBQ04_09665 [Candidatus Acidiferrales bacterium]
MSGRKLFPSPAIVAVALLCLLAILPSASQLAAQSNDNNFLFVLASGFLCDSGDASACIATAKSNQGDSYEMSGAGTMEVHGKSVRAAGSYTHRSLRELRTIHARHTGATPGPHQGFVLTGHSEATHSIFQQGALFRITVANRIITTFLVLR